MTDGAFYHCVCPDCHADYYDALPPRCCVACGSSDLVVTFDQAKRARFLAALVRCKTGAQLHEAKQCRAPTY